MAYRSFASRELVQTPIKLFAAEIRLHIMIRVE